MHPRAAVMQAGTAAAGTLTGLGGHAPRNKCRKPSDTIHLAGRAPRPPSTAHPSGDCPIVCTHSPPTLGTHAPLAAEPGRRSALRDRASGNPGPRLDDPAQPPTRPPLSPRPPVRFSTVLE
jgi:hypothetical protein